MASSDRRELAAGRRRCTVRLVASSSDASERICVSLEEAAALERLCASSWSMEWSAADGDGAEMVTAGITSSLAPAERRGRDTGTGLCPGRGLTATPLVLRTSKPMGSSWLAVARSCGLDPEPVGGPDGGETGPR